MNTCAILALTGVSTTTFHEWRTTGGFPAPIHADHFDRYEVERWLADNHKSAAPLLLTGPEIVTITVPPMTNETGVRGRADCEDALNG